MAIREDFDNLLNRLKSERDELKLQIHLASMEAREEFEAAEKTWEQFKGKAATVADEAVQTSDEYIARARIVGEELREAYRRIGKRIKK